jgi:hypothetical protein
MWPAISSSTGYRSPGPAILATPTAPPRARNAERTNDAEWLMTEPNQPDAGVLQAMLADELVGEHVTVEIGPFSAMLLIAAIQYALRRNALPGGQDVAGAAFGSLLNQLDDLVARYPGAMDIIRSQQPPG